LGRVPIVQIVVAACSISPPASAQPAGQRRSRACWYARRRTGCERTVRGDPKPFGKLEQEARLVLQQRYLELILRHRG
jgi:hypothetical protein